MYYGSGGGGGGNAAQQMFAQAANRFNRRQGEEPTYAMGFVDLFTALGGPKINVNTATATTLQLFPEVDASAAGAIIQRRAGPDGSEGNEDDMPFRSPAELTQVPGLPPEVGAILAANPYVGTRSTTFEVQVEAQIDAVKRTYFAVLRRNGPNQVILLYMYWR
jgi:hypothetical protein